VKKIEWGSSRVVSLWWGAAREQLLQLRQWKILDACSMRYPKKRRRRRRRRRRTGRGRK
jgi:hypothetical protein